MWASGRRRLRERKEQGSDGRPCCLTLGIARGPVWLDRARGGSLIIDEAREVSRSRIR